MDSGTRTYGAFLGAIVIGVANFVAVCFSNMEFPPAFGAAVRFALASFLLPLWGAHQRLKLEKEGRMRSAHQMWDAAVERVASSVQAGDFAAAQAAATAVTAAEQTLDRIGRISTWPWQPATLRGFLTAVFLPLFIWAIQQVMASRLGW